MPKETFYNLPEAKRNKIYESALDEFAKNPYRQASINRIIENAGIPKGSFYQYFTNKKDLYKFLIEEIYKKKISYLTPEMANPSGMNCFEFLKELFKSGIRFAKENPRLAKIGQHMLSDSEADTYNEIMDDKKDEGLKIYKNILAEGVKRGDVKADINLNLAAYYLFQLSNSISGDLIDLFGKSEEENFMSLVEDMIDLLENGIGSK
ncbi:TetR/AcrR family transcriptional regulator [Alkalibacter mobilis]|uniref:TetR/AcrR family transcriptional regulator n=1 Tax=Alkalibacter mobilis TaxID=2787712 RepID=UPI00189EAFF6|nr:TetR/AcrR family transcriptional regulator [Alkalibacter mobilis]MBF7096698.1 TetR/AcrR family transcriptional regulator [Alkalibacter mobilis]